MEIITAAVTRMEPTQSTPWRMPRPTLSTRRMEPATSVAMPTGTFTKKIQCHESAWVSAPPASSPTEPPPTATNTYALIALARSMALGNSVTMMATITDEENAPPMPCTKRATTSWAWLSADPQAMDARVKRATPARNTFLRPMRSPSRPAMSRKLPKEMR